MLIVSQRPGATRVAGFRTWKQLGRNVKTGAKGIMILAPVAMRKSKGETFSENDEEQAPVGFRTVLSSTNYLVICGRASARPIQAASATLESPFDSSKHIIAQLLCPVQHSLR